MDFGARRLTATVLQARGFGGEDDDAEDGSALSLHESSDSFRRLHDPDEED